MAGESSTQSPTMEISNIASKPLGSDSSEDGFHTPFPSTVDTTTPTLSKTKTRHIPSPILITPIIKPKQNSSIERQLAKDPSSKISFPLDIRPDDDEIEALPSKENTKETNETTLDGDPFGLRSRKKDDVSSGTLHAENPMGKSSKVRKVKRYYNKQNALIDAYLGSNNEEAEEVLDQIK